MIVQKRGHTFVIFVLRTSKRSIPHVFRYSAVVFLSLLHKKPLLHINGGLVLPHSLPRDWPCPEALSSRAGATGWTANQLSANSSCTPPVLPLAYFHIGRNSRSDWRILRRFHHAFRRHCQDAAAGGASYSQIWLYGKSLLDDFERGGHCKRTLWRRIADVTREQ